MTNEHLGIYEELRAKHQPLEDREQQRKRILSIGPAWNGARAEQINPFLPSAVHLRREDGYHRLHPGNGHARRKTHDEAKLGVTIAQVVQAVCIEAGLTHAELFSPWRHRRVAYPRHVAMYMIDRYCPEYSLKEIGYVFQRDHTSIMHGITKVEARLRDKHSKTRGLVALVHQRLAAIAASVS